MALLLVLSFSCGQKEHTDAEGEDLRQYLYGICTDSLELTDYAIKSGDSPASIFMGLGFSASETERMVKASAEVLDPVKLQTDKNYTAFTVPNSAQTIRYIVFAKSFTDYAVIDLTGDSVRAYAYNKQVTLKRRYVEGTLSSSLWNVLRENGTNPLLAMHIADVYAWKIDFFDVKEDDSFRVLYDEAYIDDTTALYIAAVQGAVFTCQGKEFIAIPFTQDSVFQYFNEEGESLRGTFLKAPLDFFRITSRFSNSRFHPVLKIYRAHHGVDYAAPTGTPVKSIGDGVVVSKGFQAEGGGNYVKIKHNSVYTTTYMHLHGFGKRIQTGSRVQQGEVIGYVGATGLATGPHLDFRVYRNGQPVNPFTIESPPALPVRTELTDSFRTVKRRVMEELEQFRNN